MRKIKYICLITIFIIFSSSSIFSDEKNRICDEEFLHFYSQTIARSQQKLTKMHKKGLAAYGKEAVPGDISGTCYYKTKIKPWFKIEITIEYKNYRDFDIVLNGKQIIIVNWLSKGDFIGKVKVNGKYVGHVRYELDIIKGNSSGGYYHVKHNNLSESKIDYTVVQEYFQKVRKNIDPKWRENQDIM